MPAEFKEAVKTEPLLANKQFYFMAELDPGICLRPNFTEVAIEYFQAGKALNDFFRAAFGK